MKRKFKPSTIYLIIVFIVLYAPIFYLMYYSFNSGGKMYEFDSFTFEWYQELFADTRLLIIFLNTLIIALLSSAISTIIGTFGAIAVWYVKKRQNKNTLLALNNILIVSPDVVIGASF